MSQPQGTPLLPIVLDLSKITKTELLRFLGVLSKIRYNGGVYIFYNKINHKRYVGSSSNLPKRVRDYFCPSLTRVTKLIAAAIRKYGTESFIIILVVLKEGETRAIVEMEQNFIDYLDPEYNLSPTAGSSAGVKHSPETRAKLSAAKKGQNNPQFGKVGVNAKEVYLFVVSDKGYNLLLSFPSIKLTSKTILLLVSY